MKLSFELKTLMGCLLVAALISFGLVDQKAHAVSGSEWRAGNIIDDSVFYNSNALTTSEIQTFLNSKVPTCDTWGTQPSGRSGYPTRADWGRANGAPPPYTCLKDYSDANTPTTSGDAYCAPIVGGPRPAASIIKAVSIACGINPQALVVTLQKEQGLVTDDWPWLNQYQKAMGYACPDTAPCDTQYYGFFNQVYNAARQFQRYAKLPNNYNYAVGRTSFVGYNPDQTTSDNDPSCGGTNVYMHNAATAGLYNYTPYQPNTAALNNLYGSGDDCSAYGNRNFWRMFNDWFGSPYFSLSSITMTNIAQPNSTPALGETITYTASFKNNSSVSITLDAAGIVGRLGSVNSGINRDFGWQGPVTLAPNGQSGDTWQYSFTTVVKDLGALYVWPAVNYKGAYLQYNNWGVSLNSHVPNIGAVLSPSSSLIAGQAENFSVVIRNFEPKAINLDAAGIPIRFYGAYNYDAGWTPSVSIPGNGGTATISGTVLYDKPGPYTEWVSVKIGERYITISPTYSVNVSLPSLSTSNIQLLSYSATPNLSPAVGEDVTISYTLKNTLPAQVRMDAVGVVGRYDNPYTGAGRYYDWQGPVTFAASGQSGDTQSFSFTTNISFADLRTFYAWPAVNYQGKYIHYNAWGFQMNPRLPNLTLSTPLTISSPTFGGTSSVSTTIKNNEPNAIKFWAIGIPARYNGVLNRDVVWQGQNILAPSGQAGDSVPLSGNITFDQHGSYTIWASIHIQGRYLTIGSPQNIDL